MSTHSSGAACGALTPGASEPSAWGKRAAAAPPLAASGARPATPRLKMAAGGPCAEPAAPATCGARGARAPPPPGLPRSPAHSRGDSLGSSAQPPPLLPPAKGKAFLRLLSSVPSSGSSDTCLATNQGGWVPRVGQKGKDHQGSFAPGWVPEQGPRAASSPVGGGAGPPMPLYLHRHRARSKDGPWEFGDTWGRHSIARLSCTAVLPLQRQQLLQAPFRLQRANAGSPPRSRPLSGADSGEGGYQGSSPEGLDEDVLVSQVTELKAGGDRRLVVMGRWWFCPPRCPVPKSCPPATCCIQGISPQSQ